MSSLSCHRLPAIAIQSTQLEVLADTEYQSDDPFLLLNLNN